MSDAEITEACRRDGRWHYLGTMLDVITRAITLPEGTQVGLATYAGNINPATVTKLTDRGSHQTVGIVTDVEPFLRALVNELTAKQ